jgi:hypothetical protein
MNGLSSWLNEDNKMKAYFLSHMPAILAVVLALIFATICGCSTLQSRPDAAKLGVILATAKFIESSDNPAARAARVRGIAEKVLAVAEGNPESTVAALREVAFAALPATLTPVDRAIAGALIDAVVAELTARVSNGAIPSDRLVTIKTVLRWVIDGTSYFPDAVPE